MVVIVSLASVHFTQTLLSLDVFLTVFRQFLYDFNQIVQIGLHLVIILRYEGYVAHEVIVVELVTLFRINGIGQFNGLVIDVVFQIAPGQIRLGFLIIRMFLKPSDLLFNDVFIPFLSGLIQIVYLLGITAGCPH